ncbi:MAG: flagellar hook-associated protein FlgK [Spirochaetes bacterium]|nr:flagellar hook-associated protein FlgK [Spirochaetota bacterium]
MNSTFMGIEISKRGVQSHQQALYVTGHNISNAENEEYTRQRVVITAEDPLYIPALNRAETAGNIGQGSVVARIERLRDSFVDDRIITEKNVMGYWDSKDGFIKQLEMAYNEPSDQSIRDRMDELWKGWQELSKNPELRSTRELVKERGIAVSNEIKTVYRQLYDLQVDANRQIALKVDEINTHARNIRDLNERILKSEAMGDNPNDLMDKRDALIEKLSTIVDISVGRSDKDEIIVYIGSENLIQGEVVHELEAVPDPARNGFYDIKWAKLNTDVTIKSGELAGLIEVRDVIIQDNINKINSFAANITDLLNEVHRDGFGRNGETNFNFFEEKMISDNTEGNFDLNNDGLNEVTAIFKAGGNNKIDASAAIGINGTLTFVMNDSLEAEVQVDYKESDTVNDVVKKINDGKLGVVAYIDHRGHLALKATIAQDHPNKNFMIRHLEDSGQFLVGLTGILKQSGQDGSFDYRRVNDIAKLMSDRERITITPDYNPAAHMDVSESVKFDIDKIAAARGKDVGGTGDVNTGNGIGDGTNALRIAALWEKRAMIDENATFKDYYNALISKIGSQGQESKERVENQDTLLVNLNNLRKSLSGVDLDEEMANMVSFQHGYNASAKMLSTFDKMLETILQLGA